MNPRGKYYRDRFGVDKRVVGSGDKIHAPKIIGATVQNLLTDESLDVRFWHKADIGGQPRIPQRGSTLKIGGILTQYCSYNLLIPRVFLTAMGLRTEDSIMSSTIIDFIVDFMWGASEVYLARKKGKKNEENLERGEIVDRVNRQGGDPTDAEKREVLNREFADRDEAARIIGNKTV